MKSRLLYVLALTIALTLIILYSCQKEISCEDCLSFTQPPIAKAGPNQVITLPTDSVKLDGVESNDPDGYIKNFLWTKISGPDSLTIAHADSMTTKVIKLVQGVYSFELRVTDNDGLTAKDTLIVTVNASGHINEPPVAKAGWDQAINLPNNSVTLDASGSYDPDGSIVLYSWNQIIGPNQSVIVNSSQISTAVHSLILGTYQFELVVTDNGGITARDTVQIMVQGPINLCALNRPVINAQLIPIGTLSEARQDVYTATAGNKILFAGGLRDGNYVSSRVDIYDYVADSWTTAELSQARYNMAVATVGNKIFFAGGVDQWNGVRFTRVDIYDAVANTWSIAELSSGRGYLAAATLGDKVFFAGGYYWYNADFFLNHVDIYNNTTNTWSTASLSEAREGLRATTVGNKIYFAGGSNNWNISNKIDIYDGTTNSWSTSMASEGKVYFGSIAVANKIYWAGGIKSYPNTASSQVEIRNVDTQVSTFNCLSQEKASFGTVLKGNEIVFFMGAPSDHPANFDIYNSITGVWSIGRLNEGLHYPGIISVSNKIYVAGGSLVSGGLSNKVSLLQW